MENNKDYEIGYGKPPKNTRFTKGHSGNPAGRKKKIIPDTLFQAISLELCQQKTITDASGLKEKVPLYSILAKKLVQDAIQNDGPSRKFLLQTNNLFKCNFQEIVRFIKERNNQKEEEFTDEENAYIKDYLNKIIQEKLLNEKDN